MNGRSPRAYTLQSVQNGMRILRLFTAERPEWGVTEVAAALGLSKSTAHRLMVSLAYADFLEKTPETGRYRLGLALLQLSGIISSHMELHREGVPVLKDLVDEVGEAAHIAVLEEADVVYLLKVECRHPVRLLSHIGKKNPAFCTSAGQVILAHSPEEMVERVIAAGLPPHGPQSITDPLLFRHRLREVRRRGYAICIDELHEGVVSIAAPIRDYTGEVVAAASVVGPRQRVADRDVPRFLEHLMKASERLSRKLGWYDAR